MLANLLLCNGYNFRREVSLDKMSISSSTRTRCLTQLQSLAYANSEEVYTSLYDFFKRTAPQQVMDYFDDNWHTIRHEWVQGLKKKQLNFQSLLLLVSHSFVFHAFHAMYVFICVHSCL